MEQSTSIPLGSSKIRGQRPRPPLLREPQIASIFLLFPALLIFVIFVVWPIISSGRYSLYSWNGATALSDSLFVGLKNYERLFNDPVFWRGLRNNVLVVVWSLVTQIPLAIGLAILLTGKLRGAPFFRTLYFAPLVLSDVLIGVVWGWFFNPTLGLANALLKALQLPRLGWLGDPNLALWCVLFVTTWRYLGFYIVIFIAAVQGIPLEYYEAGKIDGANGWQLHRFITIPLLIPTARTAAVLIIVGSLKFFDLVWVLTEGNNNTETLATYMFKQAFRSNDLSYGSTIAFALFIIAFVIAVLFLGVTSKRSQQSVQ